MYLVDTNVWLERLLDQDRSGDVGRFLDHFPSNILAVTDFAFHSIAVLLARLGNQKALLDFVQDVFVDGAVVLVRLAPEDTTSIVRTMEKFNLDFDDAYQYVAAEKQDLTIVSFDTDFDRTELGRKMPADILAD
jgi:predicted nucleic acid-binding protein